MERLRIGLTGLALLVGLGPLARADAPLIYCTGTESGGSGPREYAYEVDAASFPMIEFRVGTNDLDAGRYAQVLIPPGWSFAVEDEPMAHMHGVKTPHGKVSPGPCRCLTKGRARWWTEDPSFAVEGFTFGYNHPWASEDVGWVLETRREGPPVELFTMHESWDSPVGAGYGPLHGPVPEPGTMALLGLGALTVLGGAWVKRRARRMCSPEAPRACR